MTSPGRLIPSCLAYLLAAIGPLTGCSSASNEVCRGYSGEDRPDASLAKVELGPANWARFDQLKLDRSQCASVKLLPGHIHIEWSKAFGVSVLVDSRGVVERRATADLTLTEGHVYRLQAARTLGPGYRIYMWIEDAGTGEVLVGDKKP
jgi:hypothetical protein